MSDLDKTWWEKILKMSISDMLGRKSLDDLPVNDMKKTKKKYIDRGGKKKRYKVYVVENGKRSKKISNQKHQIMDPKELSNIHNHNIDYIDTFLPKHKVIASIAKLKTKKHKKDILGTRQEKLLQNKIDFRWGLGIEHEMQLFHQSKTFFKGNKEINKSGEGIPYGNIVFDSQESTCYLTGDMNKEGACCKKLEICSDYLKDENNKIKTSLKKNEYDWLMNMDWELTGRQAVDCPKGPWILERVPVLMPELITGDHRNRMLKSICDEIVDLQDNYIKLQKKNPHTRNKIKKYGKLITHPCGADDNILVPVRPTINNNTYQFEKKSMKDYLGSYHVTITLPHLKNISNERFIKMHQQFGQALQWIEPLFITSYFTGDPESVASQNEKIKGSFRIMAVGWGNLGGSDVRKFGTDGVSRGANIKLLWREKTKLDDTKLLDYCVEESEPKYPNAYSIHTSDLRTFAYDFSDKCVGSECPKIDGGKMRPPNGVEIRIFDHFDVQHIYSLIHIIILIAENSQRHPAKDYVYQDPRWIDAVDSIMRHGWNAQLNEDFIQALRSNLGLKLKHHNNKAYNIFQILVKELFKINKYGLIPVLMIDQDNLNSEPLIPQINRMCWAISLEEKYGDELRDFLKIYRKGKNIKIDNFKNDFLSEFKDNSWIKDFEDVLYSLESLNLIKLKTYKGEIKSIKRI